MKGKKHLIKKEDIPASSKKKIPEKLEKIIDFIPDDENKKEAIELLLSEITTLEYLSQTYSGPLPPSDEMVQYEKTLPGSADRIIAMAENQNEHRREMEKIDLPVQHKQFKRGQVFSLTIGLFGLSVTAVLALFGHDVVAGIIGTITIGAIIASFTIQK